MTAQAFLHVGLSFADLGIYEGSKLKAHQRFYLPQEPLTSSLKKFWTEHGEPSELTVSSRYLEKILEAKLGGTVAQIMTAGFETWPILRQPVSPNRFDMRPYRQEPLASQELIFGLSERIDSQGRIQQPVDLAELEFINSKLKLMGVKRVCVNLLFAARNPTHQIQVAKYFAEQGFEVFAAERDSDSNDEMPAWRRNVINACLSGAFTEHLEEIQKSFSNPSVSIEFLNNLGRGFRSNKNDIAGSLFAWSHALTSDLQDKADQILYLGLENWFLISTREKVRHWESPWGLIDSKSPQFYKLRIQPTTEIKTGFWGGIEFSNNELGYEPGPMSFGRALKPTVFDLLNEKLQLKFPQIQTQASKKIQDQFTAMIKSVPEVGNMSVDLLLQNMLDHLNRNLALEAQMKSRSGARKTILTGYFAQPLQSSLKKVWFDSELTLDPQATIRKFQSLQTVRGVK